ncbi:MAG: energy transducer TonB [Betaproteobacteria bacterium]|nr:energy transducer TonB [Betaproteobacteria bacterium]MCL2886706.1 energy transducer TonB [Betaproteobacteria bacterium]
MRASAAASALPAPALFSTSSLALGIGISLCLHAAILYAEFKFPEATNAARERVLDIILVNSKSANKPVDAQALAQANLDGGGSTDEDRRVKTPLPPTHRQTTGDDLQRMQRRVQELEAAQQTLLTQNKSAEATASSKTVSEQPAPASVMSGVDLLESARAMARLEGEIARNTDEYNKRPRKKFVGARTEEYGLATYLEAWRQKIERIGTLNYPEAARGKLYGSLAVNVELNVEDGSIYKAEISRSSGHKVLDQAALRILNMAAPFGPIPREAMGGNTVLQFARTWYFTQGDAFKTDR